MSHGTDRGRRSVDRVAGPDFVEGLDEAPLATVLERVRICADLDLEYAYYRRLLQGRLDILAHERARRTGEEDRDLRSALPDILARSGEPNRNIRIRRGHLVTLLKERLPVDVHPLLEALFPLEPSARAPEWLPDAGRRDIDRVLADDLLSRLDQADDEELGRAVDALSAAEQSISATRRRVLDATDEVERVAIRRLKVPLAAAVVVDCVEWLCDAYVHQLAQAIDR